MATALFRSSRRGRGLLSNLSRGVDIAHSQLIVHSGDPYAWRTQADSKVRSSHNRIEGQVREGGAEFSNGARYPRDPHAPPEEKYNCRCWLQKVAR
jgi:uncharacterized protein with gpF-like domain